MKKLLIVIKNTLGSKKLSLFFILAAFAGRIIQLVFFYNIRSDASYQLVATDNLVNGFGLTVDKVNVHDVSIKFLHINHLIQEKQALGRPKDLLDIEEMKKIKESDGA